jgi:hypothetical protein
MKGETMSIEAKPTHLVKATKDRRHPPAGLPLRAGLGFFYLLSLLIALLTAIASLTGILYADVIYPTAELQQSFVANDVVNLFIGLPILLISMGLALREKLIGLLFWPGAIFYGLYNYLIYLFGMQFNAIYPFVLLIVTLSIYTLIGLVASIDGSAVKERLTGHVPQRLAGGILLVFGAFFALRVIWIMVAALVEQMTLAGPELGLLVADFIFSGALVMGGVLLWRHQPLGYVSGAGLLFQASMLFVGLLAVFILQPLLSDTPFPLVDFIVVAAMGLLFSIPFILFVRGVLK